MEIHELAAVALVPFIVQGSPVPIAPTPWRQSRPSAGITCILDKDGAFAAFTDGGGLDLMERINRLNEDLSNAAEVLSNITTTQTKQLIRAAIVGTDFGPYDIRTELSWKIRYGSTATIQSSNGYKIEEKFHPHVIAQCEPAVAEWLLATARNYFAEMRPRSA